ncbi:Pentatricopeptide repeat-containing protein [Cynara cardunculus var. scolymus]|uniref:Pentatricopeptide repeat-containing protein n=1 Tax=Cynara cardunculus var. scolymus TaxID=59895 RepID=A0A103YBZ4_CYNCS|nr:Pentatricopeptide repeat-containing protein [Cynara cardunculus var. scolymus]
MTVISSAGITATKPIIITPFPDNPKHLILEQCKTVKDLNQIHAHLIKTRFISSPSVAENFLEAAAIILHHQPMDYALSVFEKSNEPNSSAYNIMIRGLILKNFPHEAVLMFKKMNENSVQPDEFTVLTACGRVGALELGEWIKEYIEANRLKGNATLVTALIDMYAKCGQVDTARSLFDQMSRRDVVAWSAMISGYNQASRCKEALSLFHDMQKANVEPNEVTMVSVLSSCAELGALATGKWVHFYIKKKKLTLTVTLGTALLVFYAKCGSIENLIEVFEQMPRKNVLSWTVLIQGLANNGQGNRALKYFDLMLAERIEPNDVTFIGVLCACSHAGLVDKGRGLFVSMNRDFEIEPRIEHYGCMVDILGRAGLLDEAYQFIQNMPMKPNAVIWRTLLASCKVHKSVRIGEESLKQIMSLEPVHSGDYLLLSSIYASVGRSEDALRVMGEMKKNGIKKSPGCSSIEVDGLIHELFAEETAHPESEKIYAATEKMMKQIKLAGYVPNTAEARLEADEYDKEASLSHHSEKLAIAFALIKTFPGTPIRISKNLRVCTDCHEAIKIISKVYDREIIVRDRTRFHHFKDGSCSCNDYW